MQINISPFRTELEPVSPTYIAYELVIYMFDVEIYRSKAFDGNMYSLTEFTEAAEATLAELTAERLAGKIKHSDYGDHPYVS